jgi:hypothetical protein
MRRLAILVVVMSGSCVDVLVDGPDAEDVPHDVFLRDPDIPDRHVARAGQTVGMVARTACSTAGVRPLAEQLLVEVECLRPGTLARIDDIPNVSLGAGALPKLNLGGANALRQAVSGGGTMSISSSTRATAQQYVLYYWYQNGRCTNVVSIAAPPGRSNHESGVAIDVPAYSTWRSRLEARSFRWFGSGDPVHFDYRGSGAVDIRPLAVRAFQRLWNRNNPSDRIGEDGQWGPATASRMEKSPANGFAIGPTCTTPDEPPPPPGTASLQGIVYEGTDTAARIAGATVRIDGGASTTSSASGAYRFDGLAPGQYTIVVTANGYNASTATRTVALGADNWGSVSLTRGGASGSLVGVIYRGADTSSRIAGATVTLGSGQTATSDANGVYRFSAVTQGSISITATASGHTTRTITRTIAPGVENWGSVGLAASGTALANECGSVTDVGQCDGNIVEYCDGGSLLATDCAAAGTTCGYNNAEGYYDCL